MNQQERSIDQLTGKYPSHPCDQCGTLTEGIGKLCLGCMDAQWWRETLVAQGAALRNRHGHELELARDRRTQHVALIGHPEFAFCRARLTLSRKKRRYAALGQLPPGVCATCLVVIAEAMKGEAK
jgi:hypothetical protein